MENSQLNKKSQQMQQLTQNNMQNSNQDINELFLQVYEFQVSGKTPKYINNSNGTIYKEYSQRQYQFYQFLKIIPEGDERQKLIEYIPKYLGVKQDIKKEELPEISKQSIDNQSSDREVWIEHIASRNKESTIQYKKAFILLKNVTFGYQIPNIIDLKLGTKRQKKSNAKFEKTTTNTHKFRINGMVVNLKQEQTYKQCFLSKYYCQQITVEQTQKYLALFFFNGNLIYKKLLENITQKLGKLIQSFIKFNRIRFISSSLFICYDANSPQRFEVSLIDFDKYEHVEQGHDQIILEGLVNIFNFFITINKNLECYQNVLLNKELEIFKQHSAVIPKNKIQKYSKE